MAQTKKMVLQFDDISLTLTPDDIETVMVKLKAALGREPTSKEFSAALLEHMTVNAARRRAGLLKGDPFDR